jgi:hypothetical protein
MFSVASGDLAVAKESQSLATSAATILLRAFRKRRAAERRAPMPFS